MLTETVLTAERQFHNAGIIYIIFQIASGGIVFNFVSFRLYHRNQTQRVYELFTLQDLKKKTELTVCQIRTACSALVQSLWLTGRVQIKILERVAENITVTQQRIARSRRCHIRKKRRRLREMGIDLSVIRCCILKT